MFKNIAIFTFFLIMPMGAALHHYVPYDDYVLKVPVTNYEINGLNIKYQTPFHKISTNDLVKPYNASEERVNVYVVNGPNDSAYPYIIRRRGADSSADVKTDSYFLKARVIQKNTNSFDLAYDLEDLLLPEDIASRLTQSKPDNLHVVWHIRKNGNMRIAGFEIDGENFPYQFNLNDVLVERTQIRAKIIPNT